MRLFKRRKDAPLSDAPYRPNGENLTPTLYNIELVEAIDKFVKEVHDYSKKSKSLYAEFPRVHRSLVETVIAFHLAVMRAGEKLGYSVTPIDDWNFHFVKA